ncbi:enediyne biosynthesis protein [Micromonospora sp. NPDC050495]|uniref:enediyne biosynthesis protein n=1 Tax=Micromonospora sp. NPDC050495 TaxID=3154936 RepID=UPI0033E2AD49
MTTSAPPRPTKDPRLAALRRFALSITVFNLVGYAFLGFEQPWTWPIVAVATAYATELLLEVAAARAEDRPPRFRGEGARGLMDFLLPAHISGVAVNMLLYVNDQVLVMMFGVVAAISGKWLLKAPVRGRIRHFMNPSNLGITVVLLLFPWVSVAPPYHFTENVSGVVDWLIPAVILVTGTMLNAKLTRRSWLIIGWVGMFVVQAVLRGVLLDTSIPAALATMTGVAFILFTNYMITDPGTTPTAPASQLAFGASVAVVYGILTAVSVVYGLFFATATVCLLRGGFLWALHLIQQAQQRRETTPAQRAAPVSPAVVAPAPEPEVVRA